MSVLTCEICGAVKTIAFGDGLAKGWPTCCGSTMSLGTVTADEIRRGVAQAMKPLKMIRKALDKK